MERYIKNFSKSSDVQNALDDGTLGKPYVAYVQDDYSIDWNTKDKGPITRYLTFEIVSAGTINLFSPYDYLKCDIQYKVNSNDWQTTQFRGTGGKIIGNFSPGDVIQFKGNNDSYGFFYNASEKGNQFSHSTASFKISGNIMSLIYGDDFLGKDYFPENSERNFLEMFKNCSMIVDSTGLVLPVKTLTRRCYNYMFNGCTNLNYIRCLATNPQQQDTYAWVDGVASTGTFVKASGVNWTTGGNGRPSGWTVIEE